jgi:hypothetical protein
VIDAFPIPVSIIGCEIPSSHLDFLSGSRGSRKGCDLMVRPAPRMPCTMKGQPFPFASFAVAAIVAFFGSPFGGLLVAVVVFGWWCRVYYHIHDEFVYALHGLVFT